MGSVRESSTSAVHVIGRHIIFDEIASGGMATVHLGRVMGQAGFARTVAIKRLHAQFAKDETFAAMFLDEARLAARIHHPNVVGTLDVVAVDGELLLVMEYIHGETLARLLRLASANGITVPPQIAAAILHDVLHGLHAAHDAKSETGQPLAIVHRDVSPQNVLVGADGVARVLDFGVAKAAMRSQTTHQGQVKGKIAYMAPEQLTSEGVDRRTDVYAAGIVLWEALTVQRLFQGTDVGSVVGRILSGKIDPPSYRRSGIPATLDQVVLTALARRPEDRFATALEFALALEEALPLARQGEIASWVGEVASQSLAAKARLVSRSEIESTQVSVPRSVGQLRVLEVRTNRDAEGPPTTVRPGEITGVSQVTELTAVTEPVNRLRTHRPLGAAIALALLVLIGITWLGLRPEPTVADRARSSDGSPAAQTPRSGPSPTPSPIPSPPAQRSASAPATAAVSPPSDEATASPPPASTPSTGSKDSSKPVTQHAVSARTSSQRSFAARSKVSSSPRKETKPTCNPPYRVDETGVRRVRPECL